MIEPALKIIDRDRGENVRLNAPHITGFPQRGQRVVVFAVERVWTHASPPHQPVAYRFVLYRAVNGAAFDSSKSLEGNITRFSDRDVKKGAKYEYSVGVIYKDGKKAPFGGIAKTVFWY